MISERFKASTRGFRHFLEKFESERNILFSVILDHTLNVILGFIPRIHTEHSSVDTRDKPEYDRDLMVDTRDTPEYDGRKRMYLKPENNKGMRLSTSILRHTLNVILGFIPRIHTKHSSVDTRDKPEYDRDLMVDTRVKPEYDREQSLIKGLDVVRQCAALLERLKTYIKIHPLFCHPRAWLLARPEDLDSRVKPENDYKVMQCGRSMIEMLGVLAIIGVLSVGGIAGYSKAMIKFKTNTLLQQISTIISNTQILYAQQKDHEGLDTETAIQMGIIPAELISSDGKTLVDSFGDVMDLIDWGNDSWIGFVLYMSTKEKCLAVSNADWNAFNPYIVLYASPDVEGLSYCSDRYQNKDRDGVCDGSGNKVVEKLPFSPSDVAEICSTCSAEEPCAFLLLTE